MKVGDKISKVAGISVLGYNSDQLQSLINGQSSGFRMELIKKSYSENVYDELNESSKRDRKKRRKLEAMLRERDDTILELSSSNDNLKKRVEDLTKTGNGNDDDEDSEDNGNDEEDDGKDGTDEDDDQDDNDKDTGGTSKDTIGKAKQFKWFKAKDKVTVPIVLDKFLGIGEYLDEPIRGGPKQCEDNWGVTWRNKNRQYPRMENVATAVSGLSDNFKSHLISELNKIGTKDGKCFTLTRIETELKNAKLLAKDYTADDSKEFVRQAISKCIKEIIEFQGGKDADVDETAVDAEDGDD